MKGPSLIRALRGFTFALALLSAFLALPAHAQIVRTYDASTYCEGCAVGGLDVDFGSFRVSASGLVDDGSGTYTGRCQVTGSYNDASAQISVVYIDNPFYAPGGCNANARWIGELTVVGKNFAFHTTSSGPDPWDIALNSACVKNRIAYDVALGSPGIVKKWARSVQ